MNAALVATDHSSEIDDVRAARDGDRDAFGRLYRNNAVAVHRFLVRSGAGDRAEDLVAETFLRAFRAMSRYEDRGVTFRAWLYRIATNLLIQSARKKSSTEVASDSIVVVDGSSNPAERAVAADRAAALHRALEMLEVRDRTVVVLRHLEDLPAAEVAALTGLSEANVRQIARRSLAKLERLLASLAPVTPTAAAR